MCQPEPKSKSQSVVPEQCRALLFKHEECKPAPTTPPAYANGEEEDLKVGGNPWCTSEPLGGTPVYRSKKKVKVTNYLFIFGLLQLLEEQGGASTNCL